MQRTGGERPKRGKADTRDLKQEWPGMSGNKQEGQCDQNRVNEAEEKER